MNKSLDYLPCIVGSKHFFFFADIFNPNFAAAKFLRSSDEKSG
jgi:hypothetical protein